MGIRNVVVSDISGKDIEDGKEVEVVVRSAPGLESAVRFDASADEVVNLKPVENLVQLVIKNADGDPTELVVTLEDFNKIGGDKALKKASSTRGRRPGYSPNANGR